jgi:F-type H+-transporting ATPase subunit a
MFLFTQKKMVGRFRRRIGCKILIIVLLITGNYINAFGLEKGNQPNTEKNQSKESFNPGDLILEHVGDSYDWYICTVNKKIVNVPLPIIIYSKQSGFHFFFSNKFDNGNASYLGFEISKEISNHGKIVEKLQDGSLVRPLDISITKNTLSLLISVFLLLWIFLSIARRYKLHADKAPKGLQSVLEPLILFVRDDIAIPSIGKNKYEKYLPYLLTIFFFVWINNMMGLIPIFPGGANVTGNIAITMVMALFTFVITTFSGTKTYWLHMINTPGVPWWMKLPIPLMPFIEIMGVFIKPFVLMIRLFANILAGHINLLGFICLIFVFGNIHPAIGYGFSPLSLVFAIFLNLLELLVAFIQAYVFTLLSALYFGMALEEAHH